MPMKLKENVVLVIVREGGNTEVVSHNAKMTFSDFT